MNISDQIPLIWKSLFIGVGLIIINELLSGSTIFSIIIFVISISSGLWGKLLVNNQANSDINKEIINNLADVVSKVVPIINIQIELSRNQMDQSIADLSRRFVDMVVYIEAENKATPEQAANSLSEDNSQGTDNKEKILKSINEIIVLLQFQDRVSQILEHICASLNMVSQHVSDEREAVNKGHASILDLEKILADLEKNYTTAEEHKSHAGEKTVNSKEGSIEFF